MDNQKTGPAPAPAPRQLSLALDPVKLRGISPPERDTIIVRLARVLLEAAGVRRGVTMNGADLLPASVLKRKAVVYVRQSTPAQVQFNLESQRQQYELVEVARRQGSTRSNHRRRSG